MFTPSSTIQPRRPQPQPLATFPPVNADDIAAVPVHQTTVGGSTANEARKTDRGEALDDVGKGTYVVYLTKYQCSTGPIRWTWASKPARSPTPQAHPVP